jgi:hypothetical protein
MAASRLTTALRLATALRLRLSARRAWSAELPLVPDVEGRGLLNEDSSFSRACSIRPPGSICPPMMSEPVKANTFSVDGHPNATVSSDLCNS